MLAAQTKPVRAVGVELEHRSLDRRDRDVSWVYPNSKQYIHPLSTSHSKPRHYSGSLFIPIRKCEVPELFSRDVGVLDNKCGEQAVADELNIKLLVGAKSVEDTLKQYEIDVGISFVISDPTVVYTPSRSLCRSITDDEIALRQERWTGLVKSLAGEPIGTRSCLRDNSREDPSSEFVSDLTDSEQSVDSDPLPSTPKPKESYPNVIVRQPSPTPFDYSSTVSLGAPASLFTPTSTTPAKTCPTHFPSWPLPPAAIPSTPSPIYTNFSFPSLNSSIQSLPPNLTKDEQGFYTEVSSPPSATQESCSSRTTQRPPSAGLSSFLIDPSHRTRKTSKTRVIIDQLRSASANDFDRPHNKGTLPTRPSSTPYRMTLDVPFSSSSGVASTPDIELPSTSCQSDAEDFDEEGDGWIRAEIGEGDSSSGMKAQRTQGLVQVLDRNRPQSTRGESDANQWLTDWEVIGEASDISKASITNSYESSSRRKSPRHRSRKSHGRNHVSRPSFSAPALAPPAPLPLSPLPPAQPYFPVPAYPAYPAYTTPYPYTAYKPSQISTQPHFFPAHVAYPPPTLFGTTMYPPGIQLPPSSSVVNVQSTYNRDGITGASGMKHTQW